MAPAAPADASDIAVIGAGPAGMAAARHAAARGRRVVLFERAAAPGGRPAAYGCKAVRACAKCGVCVNTRQAGNLDAITVRNGAAVDAVAVAADGFAVTADGSRTAAAAVVIATGFEPYDAARKGRFGMGRVPGVIDGIAADRMMARSGDLRTASGEPVRKAAFIQCVGSRDRTEGHDWCSRACCAYALRMAAQAAAVPDASVAVFHMDIQDFGKGSEALRAGLAAAENVRFVRCIPGRVDTGADGRPMLGYESTDGTVREAFDLVVLSVGMLPRPSTRILAEACGIGVQPSGFIASRSSREPLRTSVDGIFAAGTCRTPMTIPEAIADGDAAAELACGFGGKA